MSDRVIRWQRTGGKSHRVTIDEGALVSPLLANAVPWAQAQANSYPAFNTHNVKFDDSQALGYCGWGSGVLGNVLDSLT